ncbi:MAG: hypothetical protein IKN27_01545 [Selenomonadaceae bacterium]|nr:hypothetical protein [Selenomonadaceae bacterium]
MLRKIFSTILLATFLLLTACGQKLPETSADKTVEAYAQLYTCGEIDDELKPATNLTDADIAEARGKVIATLVKFLERYSLSEETLQVLTKKYLDRLNKIKDITATLHSGDKAHPVVELVTTSINHESAVLFAEEDEDLDALEEKLAELKAQGVTDDELKRNPEFQKFALEKIGSFLDGFVMNAEATILVPCKIVTGADGKLYWQPENVGAIEHYISGQK